MRILRGERCCLQCGATDGEPCLTWRGDTFLDGTTHAGLQASDDQVFLYKERLRNNGLLVRDPYDYD